MHGRQARSRAEVRQNYASLGGFPSAQPGELFHQVGVRQTMEPVASYALPVEPSRDRQQRGHTRHVVMESRVEAHHLRNIGAARVKQLDEMDLHGQVFRIERAELSQFVEQFRRHALRSPVARAAMDDAVADAPEGG